MFDLRAVIVLSVAFGVTLCFCRVGFAQEHSGFGPRELKAIEETLYTVNAKPSDMGYRKGPLPTDPCRLPLVDKLLHDPISIPAQADRLLAPCENTPSRQKSWPSWRPSCRRGKTSTSAT